LTLAVEIAGKDALHLFDPVLLLERCYICHIL
jgi:hypothetical protein